MFTITKRFSFSASHQLAGLPEGHQCARLHGHNYEVEVELAKTHVNQVGFVRDYGDLQFVKDFIDRELDHRHLNDIVQFNPTAECLAEWLFIEFFVMYPELVAVRVSETLKTWAEYRLPTAPRPVLAPDITIINPPLSAEEEQVASRVVAILTKRLAAVSERKP